MEEVSQQLDADSVDLGQIAKDMMICQIMSTAFPVFYKKTSISPKFIFSYDNQGLAFDIGFSPRQPNQSEWNILIEEIFESEKLIQNNTFLNKIPQSVTMDQLRYKLVEEIRIIANKRKNFYLENPQVNG